MSKNAILEDHDDWLLIDVSNKRYPNGTCKIDRDMFLRIWNKISLSHVGYPIMSGGGKLRYVHKFVVPHDGVVDHINRDKTDVRACNLRKANQSINCFNRTFTGNSSNVKGVAKDGSGWSAHIGYNGEKIYLGYFKRKSEAVKARAYAELKYFGIASIYHKDNPEYVQIPK